MKHATITAEDTAGPALVDLQAIEFRYPKFLLGPLTLKIDPGAAVALVGPNGAGKTTLLGILSRPPRRFGGYGMDPGNQPGPGRSDHPRAGGDRSNPATGAPLDDGAQALRLPLPLLLLLGHGEGAGDGRSARPQAGLPAPGAISRAEPERFLSARPWAREPSCSSSTSPRPASTRWPANEALRQIHAHMQQRPDVAVVLATHILEDLEEIPFTTFSSCRKGRP